MKRPVKSAQVLHVDEKQRHLVAPLQFVRGRTPGIGSYTQDSSHSTAPEFGLDRVAFEPNPPLTATYGAEGKQR